MGFIRVEVVDQDCPNDKNKQHYWTYVIVVDYHSTGDRRYYFVCDRCHVCCDSDNEDALGRKELYRNVYRYG